MSPAFAGAGAAGAASVGNPGAGAAGFGKGAGPIPYSFITNGPGGGPFGQPSPGFGAADITGRSYNTAPPAGWGNAISGQGPSFGERFGNWLTSPIFGGGQSGSMPAKTSPLSMDTYQSSRTASLVIRNVPGANIYMSAAGMTA